MDTMDKLGAFIDTINAAMPGAWNAAVKQAYIYGILCAVMTAVCVVVFMVCAAKIEKTKDMEDMITIVALFAIIIGVGCLIATVLLLTNPQYWAIQMLKP